MALEKKGVDVSFAEGLETKTDPKRLQMGKFLQLRNTVFNKGGEAEKRNGFGKLTALPDDSYTYLTTFNDNLTAIGSNIAAYNDGSATWVQKGQIQPLSISTLPVIRNNLNQSSADCAIASNGTACAVFVEVNEAGNSIPKYVVFDSETGQNIVAPVSIPITSGNVSGGLRVYVLGNHFVIVFTNTITAVAHLQYIAINILIPTSVTTNTDIAAAYVPATTLSWDAYVVGNRLYVAYNTTSGGQSIKVAYLTSGFILSAAVTFAAQIATAVSVTADETNPAAPIIYVSYYDSSSTDGYSLAVDFSLNTVRAPTAVITGTTVLNITSSATGGKVYIYYEVSTTYTFTTGTGQAANLVDQITMTASSGAVSVSYVVARSIGLASKSFMINGVMYFLAAYQSLYQPTYFLINATQCREEAPVIVAKLAYENGGGYLTIGLPNISIQGTVAKIPYRFKDLIQAVNKNTAIAAGNQVVGIYSQTGINLGSFTFGTESLNTAEIGNDLHLTGGFLGMYDGYLPVEHQFFLYPDLAPTSPPSAINSSAAAWSATGGSMAAQPDGATNANVYFYQVTYEWTDNQGNAFRSAPSIPISVTTTGALSTGSVVLKIPTLRLTMKTANPVKIVIYRWSVAQQVYYQITSITAPLLNVTTVNSVTFTDTFADATILGNNALYTTGGVIENISAPACNVLALFDSRLWYIDAENPDSIGFSKQVIQSTPVETSDLFTIFVPRTTATQGSTGTCKTLYPMDDKLIIGKDNALVYVNGTGPDNTGANNQYSQPIFITSTVGSNNQKSIVLMPQGLMFQAGAKGIWLLNRNLETSYIGSSVEAFTQGATVLSAINVPETNQVRFTLDTGIDLMYDYFYGQWSVFTGIPGISSCIFQSMHTFINDSGLVYQETPNQYLDGDNPVLILFETGPLRVGELQNYQRAYFFYLLGTYRSPHKLRCSIKYDYEASASQSIIINPNPVNFSTLYGAGDSQSPYGQQSPYGGPSNLENWRVFLERQRCMAFSILVEEFFDATYETVAGGGLSLSGLNVVMGFKKGYHPQPNASTAG